MGRRTRGKNHDRKTKKTFGRSIITRIAKLFGKISLSLFLSRPIMAMVLVPALLLSIAFLPLILLNLLSQAFAPVASVLGVVVSLALNLLVAVGLVYVTGRLLGYDVGRETIEMAWDRLRQIVSNGPLNHDWAGPTPSNDRERTSDSDESTSNRTDSFLVPLSGLFRNEMAGYNEGWLSAGAQPVSLEPNYSTLVLGEPGAGKTTTINLLLRQMDAAPDEPVIIFDYKGEFEDGDLFPDRELTVLSVTDADVNWNVFYEANDEGDYREIADKLIDVDDDENRNEFFAEAATELVWAALVHLDREHAHPTNREFVAFFEQSRKAIFEDLVEHDDLGRVAEQIGGPNNSTGRDILATARPFVNKVFTGDFGRVGGFSVRNYLDEPGGRVLVIQADIAQFERTKPAIRFLVDWAIQHGLADASRNAYYVLDEFQRVPNLRNIENLTGAGRAQRAQAILGLQGISQLESSYDEGLANAIVAGATQEILMRPGDAESTEHVQNALGSEIVEHEEEAPGFGKRNVKQEEVRYLSERAIRQFEVGEAIIKTPDGFVHGRVKQWDDLTPEERRRLL